MSLKFQTAKWNVEINWKQMTLTPLGTANGHRDSSSENTSGIVQTNNTNYFLFDLIDQIFTPGHKQEHLSQ
jgi:hypothetical protein